MLDDTDYFTLIFGVVFIILLVCLFEWLSEVNWDLLPISIKITIG